MALDMVPTGSVSRDASRALERKDQLISRELLGKGAERFGWSASVWLSKHLNGRQPALLTKQALPVVSLLQRSARRSQCQTPSGK